MTWRGEKTIYDRLFACVPYALPLVSVIPFGGFLMQQFPPLVLLFQPLSLLSFIYAKIPFASLAIFILLLLLVVRNERVPHFIRFNTMQGLLLQMAVFLCGLFMFNVIEPDLRQNLIVETLFNIIFLSTLAACIYSIVQSILGRYAELPGISEAVYAQVR